MENGAGDNVKRGIRTAIQVGLGLLAEGGLTQVWDTYNKTHTVDPTIQVALLLVLTGVAAWAMNLIEDKTGKALLAPKDRQLGDQVLGTGLTGPQ